MMSRAVEDYLTLRRSLGFQLVDTAELLASFTTFAEERDEAHVRAATAIEWASLRASLQRRRHCLRTLRLFAEHARSEDIRHEVVPTDTFAAGSLLRHPPKIFTIVEISRLMSLADDLGPADSTRGLLYRTLIGLLFVTGMRISEALQLCFEDFDGSALTIRKTKFGKARWLPLHPSTVDALETYLMARREVVASSERLFISLRKTPLTAERVRTTFQTLCAQAAIDGAGARRKPRLHDIRHSFAVHALRRCGADRDAVERHMLALSTYMGHVSVSSTYWYMEATPELMRDIAEACDVAEAEAKAAAAAS